MQPSTSSPASDEAQSQAADVCTSVQIPEGVLFREVGGEAVVLELETGHYYGLDPVGTRIWSLLTEDGRIDRVHELLVAEYDEEPERLRQDLDSFVHQLLGRGLLKAGDT